MSHFASLPPLMCVCACVRALQVDEPCPKKQPFLFASNINGGGAHYSGLLVCGAFVCERLHRWHHVTVSVRTFVCYCALSM